MGVIPSIKKYSTYRCPYLNKDVKIIKLVHPVLKVVSTQTCDLQNQCNFTSCKYKQGELI